MSTPDVNDRREYYRIEDQLALDFRPLRDDEIHATEALQDDSRLFNLLSELHLYDFESQHLLRHVNENDRALTSYLKLVNKRMDLMTQALVQSLLPEISSRLVKLSEASIDFPHPQAVDLNLLVALKIILLPQGLALLLRAKVIDCQPQTEGGYTVSCEFQALSDTQRQLLARHIFQHQAHQRRQARTRQRSPNHKENQ